MKVSVNWLKEYVDISIPAKELAKKLSMIGLTVEEIQIMDPFPGVVIGKVLEVQKHPNADRLSLTKVDTGGAVYSIVCGAPNVAAGQVVPVALEGTKMPGGFEIKKAKIRGVDSCGMICSKSELGYEPGKSEGIWDLDPGQPHRLGQPFAEYLKVSDVILDIDVTSNRADCLSLLGIAREIAVMVGAQLKKPVPWIRESGEPVDQLATVQIEDTDGCTRYAARVIRGIRVGPSPDWLRQRLEAVGSRSINNIVDITNYVLLECGQPLHAFDYDRIAGHAVIVRASAAGERFQTLDEKEHTLPEKTVLICDAEKAIALGGIMGGRNSEISDGTVNVLLESAYFEPVRIRRASKRLQITSDASVRFSRGVDPDGMIYAIDRAAQLITELAGGRLAPGVIDVKVKTFQPPEITLRLSVVHRLLDASINADTVRTILESLGCRVSVTGSSLFTVVPPSFRTDLRAEHDLIEEVARIYGYDRLPSARQATVYYRPEENKSERLSRLIRQTFLRIGFDEAVTNSMVNPKPFQMTDGISPEDCIRLINPLNEDFSVLRAGMLPSLLEVLRTNLYQKNEHVRIFEIGKIYRKGKNSNGLADEKIKIAGCACGNRTPEHWQTKSEPIDFYDLKNLAQEVVTQFKLDNVKYNAYTNLIYTSQAMELVLPASKIQLGHFGKIKKPLLREFDIDTTVWYFEFDFEALLSEARFTTTYQPISRFPSIQRDLAVTVARDLEARALMESIRSTAGALLTHLGIFDVYTGKPIAEDKKSVAFSLTFRSEERTLTEDEIDVLMGKIIKRLEKQYQAQLRQG